MIIVLRGQLNLNHEFSYLNYTNVYVNL